MPAERHGDAPLARRGRAGSGPPSAPPSLGRGRLPWVEAFVDRFTPPEAAGWPIVERQRARLMILILLPYFVALVGLAGYLLLLDFWPGAALLCAGGLVALLTLPIIRRTGAIVKIGNGHAALSNLIGVATVWINGGIVIPAVFALTLAPMSMLLILNRKWAAFWGLVTSFEIGGLWLMHRMGYAPEVRFAGNLADSQLVISITVLWLAFAVAALFDRQKNEALDRIAVERDRARAGSQAKTAFLANMSHELRTPMNGVIGMLELALDEELPEEVRARLMVARRSARSFSGLLDSILDLSRLEEGGIEVQARVFELSVLLTDLVALLRPSAEAKGLTLSLEIADAVPGEVACDPLRLRQVVMNLVGNAIKFTQEGSVELKVDCGPTRVRAGQRFCELQVDVVDTGPGIDDDDLERIFGRFERVDASPTRSVGGVGLGLAITRQLLDLMGGSVTARKRSEGHGSVFSVRLEVEVRVGEVSLNSDIVRSLVPGERSAGRAHRVLVVDDDMVNRQVAVAALRVLGCDAVPAETGEQAIEKVGAEVFDLVLMDCHMPGMDGFEAANTLRGLAESDASKRVPVVALTASVTQADRERCYAAGMTKVLAKPLRRAELAAVVDELAPPKVQPRKRPQVPASAATPDVANA